MYDVKQNVSTLRINLTFLVSIRRPPSSPQQVSRELSLSHRKMQTEIEGNFLCLLLVAAAAAAWFN